MCLTKKEKKKRERDRQTNFPAPDFSIGWANTGGLSVLILHFWQSEQPFSPSHGSAFFSIIIIIIKKKHNSIECLPYVLEIVDGISGAEMLAF